MSETLMQTTLHGKRLIAGLMWQPPAERALDSPA